jgi:alpha/beta superfamily hydrolase
MSNAAPAHDGPITIGGRPGRTLEGILTVPAADLRGAAVVCHPHPQYQGTMNSPVVVATCEALVAHDIATLRFNFGGAGRSQGTFSGGPEEIADTQAALVALGARLPSPGPLARSCTTLVGYPFGAWIALQTAAREPAISHVIAIAPPLDFFEWQSLGALRQSVSIIAAAEDQFCDAARLAAAVQQAGPRTRVVATVSGTDHFFGGFENDVAAACAACLDCSA